MAKKVIIVVVTMLCVVVGLVIYGRYSRVDGLETDGPVTPPSTRESTTAGDEQELVRVGPADVGVEENITVVKPTRNGFQKYSFEGRIKGNSGTFDVSKPQVAIYSEGRPFIRLTAEVGSAPIESGSGQPQIPQTGSLQENVRIEIYRPLEEGSDPKATVELREENLLFLVELDRIEFKRDFSMLESPGRVKISSEQFHLAGRDLTLQYDQINARLQDLQLRQVDYLRMPANFAAALNRSGKVGAKGDESAAEAAGAVSTEESHTLGALFTAGDFVKPGAFLAKLRNPVDPLSSYLQQNLSNGTRVLLGEMEPKGAPSAELMGRVCADLNGLLQSGSLYLPQRFSQVELPESVTQIIEKNLTGLGLIRLNRLLLQHAYPAEIAAARMACTYRLSLLGDIVLDMPQEKQRLTAEEIDILTDMDFSRSLADDQGSVTKEREAAESSGAGAEGTSSDTLQSTITITCTGPLQINVAEPISLSAHPDRLELNAFGQPAQLWQNEVVMLEADILQFDQTNQVLRIAADEHPPIRMNLDARQKITAHRQIFFDQRKGLASFFGPGRIENLDANTPTSVAYEDELQIKFAVEDHAGNNLLTPGNFKAEWIEFRGGLEGKYPASEFRADSGQLSFFTEEGVSGPPTDTASDAPKDTSSGARMPPLESLKLSGHVETTFEDNQFAAEELNVAFELDAEGQSHPREIIAQDDIHIETPDYVIETSQELQLVFDYTAAGPDEKSRPGDEPKTGDDQGSFSETWAGGKAFDHLVSARAVGADNGVRLTDKVNQYQVSGDRADYDGQEKLWTIQGQPAAVVGLAQNAQLQELRAPVIRANLQTDAIEIPGPSELTFLSEVSLTGADTSEPIPVQIRFGEGASYSKDRRQIVFRAVTTQMDHRNEQGRIRTTIRCPVMTVNLPEQTPSTAGLASDEARVEKLASLIAEGPDVRVVSEQYSLESEEVLSRAEIRSQQLRFDSGSGHLTAEGPGWIWATDYRIPSARPAENPPQSIETLLSGSLRRRGPSYTLVQFDTVMSYDVAAKRLQFEEGAALDHLPLVENITVDASGIPAVEGLYRLDSESITITLVEEEETPTKGGTDIDPGEQMQLQRLLARGKVFFETIDNGRHRIFTAETAEYNSRSRELVFVGTEKMPVRFDQMQFRRIRYNLDTGNFDGQPLGLSRLANSW